MVPARDEAATEQLGHRFHGVRRRIWTYVAALIAAATTVLVLAYTPVSGDATTAAQLDLGQEDPPTNAISYGAVERNVDGFAVDPGSTGTVFLPLPVQRPRSDNLLLLRLTAYGSSELDTRVRIVGSGIDRYLGAPESWDGKEFGLTGLRRRGQLSLAVSTRNSSDVASLFLDRVVLTTAPETARTEAPAWLIAIWIGTLAAALLSLARQLRRHWVLPGLLALGGAVLWNPVAERAFEPLEATASSLWAAARDASWLGLDGGLLTGSYDVLSPLAVQLAHALTPITGGGSAGARAASVLVAIAALAALYAAGNRIAGRTGAVTAVLLALISDAFREAAVAGGAVPAAILAATVLLIAIHACLAKVTRPGAVILGVAGAVAALAEPAWVPGILAATALLVVLRADRPERWRLLGVTLLAFTILFLPNRVATAHQNGGDMLADLGDRATLARNIEFVGQGHGAPATRDELSEDPLAGERVGLGEYVLGDHSLSVAVGGVFSALYDGLDAAGQRDETRLLGLVAFAFSILGTLYLLVVPHLRLLVLLPVLVAAPTLFLASRGAITPYEGGAAFWPALFCAGGVLGFVLMRPLRARWAPGLPAVHLPKPVGRLLRQVQRRRRRTKARA